jgi:hypothetical protein
VHVSPARKPIVAATTTSGLITTATISGLQLPVKSTNLQH